MNFEEHMRAADSFANLYGCYGFPTFHLGGGGFGVKLIPKEHAEWHNVPASELKNPGTTEKLFTEVDNWKDNQNKGYSAAFPNMQERVTNGIKYHGVVCLKAGVAEHKDFAPHIFGYDSMGKVKPQKEEYFQDVDTWQSKNRSDIGAAFPTFQFSDDYNDGINPQWGVILIKKDFVRQELIHYTEVGFFGWEFDQKYSEEHKQIILRHQIRAFRSIENCVQLDEREKFNLYKVYKKKKLPYGLETSPRARASAPNPGGGISINFDFFWDVSEDEQAQTLIHEMMHIAGYSHPDKIQLERKEGKQYPGDGGKYYGTPPLQAEYCIAGKQSLTLCANH